MAEHFLKTDSRNISVLLDQTFTRGTTFVKLTGQRLIDPKRDDTQTRIHDHVSTITRRTAAAADDDRRRSSSQQTNTDTNDDDEEEDDNEVERNSNVALSGLALARLQHRAKKSTASQQRLQERRGSNPDRSSTRSTTSDDSTASHMTSEMTTSHREAPARTIERPTSSWASRSGRRPNYTESGWEVDDDDFAAVVVVDSRIEKMVINESNSYTTRRATVNEAPCHSPHDRKKQSPPTGSQDSRLIRRASDSSRARSYKEAAKELRREQGLAGGSHKKRDEGHSNGSGSSSSSISMTDGELARMRAVSRLSHATPQLTTDSPSSTMHGAAARHLPRKLNPLPVSQVNAGTDMALDEEEEEEEEAEEEVVVEKETRLLRKGRRSSWGNNGSSVDEPAARRRGSREHDSSFSFSFSSSTSAMFFSDPKTPEKNIIPKPKLKPIARK